ncbi:hypothetical protein D3C86_1325940 [compost metagenome]
MGAGDPLLQDGAQLLLADRVALDPGALGWADQVVGVAGLHAQPVVEIADLAGELALVLGEQELGPGRGAPDARVGRGRRPRQPPRDGEAGEEGRLEGGDLLGLDPDGGGCAGGEVPDQGVEGAAHEAPGGMAGELDQRARIDYPVGAGDAGGQDCRAVLAPLEVQGRPQRRVGADPQRLAVGPHEAWGQGERSQPGIHQLVRDEQGLGAVEGVVPDAPAVGRGTKLLEFGGHEAVGGLGLGRVELEPGERAEALRGDAPELNVEARSLGAAVGLQIEAVGEGAFGRRAGHARAGPRAEAHAP